ncbi:MAG: S8 family serine peptidase [Anaerolineae bacterium]|nr:S8 family serine peptidase [Anaerolineae bacterium]
MNAMLRKRVLSLLSMLVVLSMVFTPYTVLATEGGPEVTDGDQPTLAPADYWIVQLTAAPLAQYTGGITGLQPTAISATGADHLNVNTPVAQAYIAYLKTVQAEVAQNIQKAIPGAVVERDYQVVFNGMAIKLPQADEQAQVKLFKVPGIKQVFRQEIYYPDMYASLPLIGAPAMWAELGGQDMSGEGLKVAVIDTGIYITNTCFTPDGYAYPEGFPKMDTDKPAATNEKVIAARAYFRPDDPPVTGDGGTWAGAHGSSHATHVGGTIACVPGTVAETGGYTETISGVAPAAQLMSYRVFYPAESGSASGWSAELIAAIEDAVIDGADVANNSWGGGSSSVYPDPLDLAYDAAWDAGVVIVFSAGNAGPYPYTMDHASDKDISVGASTTSGTIAAGRLGVSAPEPISDTLQNMAFIGAAFGAALEVGQVYVYDYLPGAAVDPANYTGCNAWPADTFTGKAAIISRGSCEFGVKVLNAENAGADFVVIYNNAGDSLISMGAGEVGDQVTIPSVFIGQTNGEGMVAWYADNGAASELTLDNVPFQASNTPDLLASFTSRGSSIRQTMGIDVVAPGVNIFSSGYGLGSGETVHMGFGQASGTSMAAPHVSGSAALLKQLHPDWTPGQIKSALMSTAELVLLDYDGVSEVGATDRGAGRIDLNVAGDPGLTFDKPSLSFGYLAAGESAAETVAATDVFSHATTFTYTLTVEETGDVTTTGYFTLSVAPATLAFDAMGDTGSFDVSVDIAPDAPAGTYEGLVWLADGSHTLHIPVWIQVWPEMGDKVLLLDNDFSYLVGYPDYTWYYTSTLETLGVPYDYYEADMYYGNTQTIPDLSVLQQYKAVIWYTGDHWQYNGYYTVATPLTELDEDILMGYLQGGGRLLATGQDLAATLRVDTGSENTNLYESFLGAEWLQDDVFAGTPATDTHQLQGQGFASSLNLDISIATTLLPDGAGNQAYVDEIKVPDVGEGQPEPVVMPEPIFQATSGAHIANGYTGLATSSDASLETPMTYADWRTVYLSFGFEGINNPAADQTIVFDSRATTMMHLLSFLFTQPAVELPDVVAPAGTITLEATAGFASGDTTELVQYRWDFGDNSPIQTTTDPTANHSYGTGTYTARVEVTDFYGHTAIAEGTVEVTKAHIYLPLVMRAFGTP